MDNSFVFSIWLGAILYAFVGVFGLLVFYSHGPTTKALIDGYGVAENAVAAPQIGNHRTLIR